MRSFRLKRRKLSGRKLSGRKLRRGGNGSSSSSQVSLDNLFDELNRYEIVDNEIYHAETYGVKDPETQIPIDMYYDHNVRDRERSKRNILNMFNTNRCADIMSTISKQDFIELLINVLNTEDAIIEAFGEVCRRSIDTKKKDDLYVEIMHYIQSIKNHVISDNRHQVDEVLKILNKDFKKDEAMVESLSFLPKDKLQDRLSKPGTKSTELGLLPNELVRYTMPYLRSTHPSYHISTSPNQYPVLQENAVQYASDNSSSTKKGGRRRMKSNRSRKTRRRK